MKVSFEKGFYIFGWMVAIVATILLVLYTKCDFSIFSFSQPCFMYDKWGLYCPGCGGTRALRAFMQGKIILSLYYNPILTYGIVVYACFMISQTLEIATKGKLKGMRYKDVYAYFALIVLGVHFVVKNALILMGIVS